MTNVNQLFLKQTERKANELALKVLPKHHLKSFLQLDLESKITGIATFAHIANDEIVRDAALTMIRIIKGGSVDAK